MGKYSCNSCKDDIRRFLLQDLDFSHRQEKALTIVDKIMEANGKSTLYNQLGELARVEYGVRELEPWPRDHVVHALLSFILGIYINEHFLEPKGKRVDGFQWKLAGLFHDVGYPVEIAHRNILLPYVNKINQIKEGLGLTEDVPDLGFQVILDGLTELSGKGNSLCLIQEVFKKCGVCIDVGNRYKDSLSCNHGIFSSLSILYMINLMYKKNNPLREYREIRDSSGIRWDEDYFDSAVVPACAAIFAHAFPNQHFSSISLDKGEACLIFLLKIADCLQDWERPSAKNKTGFSNEFYSIDVRAGKLVFSVSIDERKQDVQNELSTLIQNRDIDII